MKKIIEHLKLEWWKYELETLVVIVGILGAFTLNNWNESRKDKIIEQGIYKNLQTSLRKTAFHFHSPTVHQSFLTSRNQ